MYNENYKTLPKEIIDINGNTSHDHGLEDLMLLKLDFPGGPVVKNPPFNAGDRGSIPGWGTKISHAAGKLNPYTTATELVHLNETAHVLQTTEPMRSGACMPELERENPHAATREKPEPHNEEPVPQRRILHASVKTPCASTET